MANGVNAKKKRAQPWNEIYSTSILRPYAELMPQSIVFIYQNVCKKVPSSILQYSYVIFLPLLACGFGFPNQFLIFSPSSFSSYGSLSIYLSYRCISRHICRAHSRIHHAFLMRTRFRINFIYSFFLKTFWYYQSSLFSLSFGFAIESSRVRFDALCHSSSYWMLH